MPRVRVLRTAAMPMTSATTGCRWLSQRGLCCAATAGVGLGIVAGMQQNALCADIAATGPKSAAPTGQTKDGEVDNSPTRDPSARTIPLLARVAKIFAVKKVALAKVKAA